MIDDMGFYKNIVNTQKYERAEYITSTYEWWFKKLETPGRHRRRKVRVYDLKDPLYISTIDIQPHDTRENFTYKVYNTLCQGYEVTPGFEEEYTEHLVEEMTQNINTQILNTLRGLQKEQATENDINDGCWNILEKKLYNNTR